EKAATKGHCYLTLVCDLAEGTMEPIAEDRTQESLDGYDAGLTQPQLDGIEAVAMDRGEPSLQATRAWVRDATKKIVFDRFHIRGHVGQAVDTVRKQEHRTLMASSDERLKGNVLVALQPGECTGTPASRVRRTDVPGAQGRAGVGHQRGVAPSVALRLPSVKLEALEAVVFLGDTQLAGADSKAAETIRRHIDNI
ncbi:MAG: transposase, partial [Nitrospiraceae bacterium]